MKAIDYIASQQWAITPEGLERIVAIAERVSLSVEDALTRRAEFEVVADAMFGAKLEGSSKFSRAGIRDGVAIIPVRGTLIHYANFFSNISGATSITNLTEDLRIALASDEARSILLYIDSPGGEVSGVNGFSKTVRSASQQKPIVAFVAGEGASAAYWIASAADEVVAEETSLIGSIGVMTVIKEDTGKRDQERGEIAHRYISSQSPKKRVRLGTESGDAVIQKVVDDLADVFVRAVAENRGVSREKVLEDFGQGGLLVGRYAVEAGLADKLGSFEGTLAMISAQRPKRRRAQMTTKTPAQGTGGNGMSVIEKIKAVIAGEETKATAESAAAEPEKPKAAAATAAATERPEAVAASQSDESAKLRREVESLKAERRKEKAEAFADRIITVEHRAFPAERDAIIAAYTQALEDDDASPLASGSRAAKIEAQFTRRPAHTTLLKESLAPADVRVLFNEGGDKKEEVTPERKTELLKLTPLGQSVAATAKKN